MEPAVGAEAALVGQQAEDRVSLDVIPLRLVRDLGSDVAAVVVEDELVPLFRLPT